MRTIDPTCVQMFVAAVWVGISGLAATAVAQVRPADASTQPALVYSHTFEKPPGAEWSRRDTDVTPKGKRRFLGRFRRQDELFLKLAKLPKHKLIRLSFDLYVIQGVDGNNHEWGRDVWELGVVNGRRLIRTSFCNRDLSNRNNEQSFPDEYGVGRHPAWTGCAEKEALGWTEERSGRAMGRDSAYRMQLVFPHTDPTLGLRFASCFAEIDLKDLEAWGLDNVKVEALATPARIDAKTFGQLRAHLGGSDPVAAFKALWQLAAAGDATVAALKSEFPAAASAVGEKVVEQLIAALDHDEWRVREKATQGLVKLGKAVEGRLRRELAKTKSREVQNRIPLILAKIGGGPAVKPGPRVGAVSTVRMARTCHLLEVIGTPAAEAALKTLRDGAGDFRLRHMANDARARLIAERVTRVRAAAEESHKAGQTASAIASLRKALGAADKDAVGAKFRLSACLARLNAMHQAAAGVDKLRARLKADNADQPSREKLIRLLLVDLDRPAEAAKLVTDACDKEMRACLALAAMDPKKLPGPQCLRLGKWYHQLATKAGAAKEAMLRRAVACYGRALDAGIDDPVLRKSAVADRAKAGEELLETELATGRPVELLRLIDPKRDTLRGNWRRGTGLNIVSGDQPYNVVRLPLSLAGSYELTVCFVPFNNRSIDFDLPVGAGHAAVALNARPEQRHGDGILGIDGKEVLAGEGTWRAPSRTRGRGEQILYVKVLLRGDQAEIMVDLDHVPLLRWRGPQKRLMRKEVYENHKNRQIAFGTWRSRVAIRGLRFRMLSGKVRLLRP